VASLWLVACGLELETLPGCNGPTNQKILYNSSGMTLAAGHGPPGTMAAGRYV